MSKRQSAARAARHVSDNENAADTIGGRKGANRKVASICGRFAAIVVALGLWLAAGGGVRAEWSALPSNQGTAGAAWATFYNGILISMTPLIRANGEHWAYECEVLQPDPPATIYKGPTVPGCPSGSSKFAGTASGCIETPYPWANGPSCTAAGNPITLGRGNKYQRVVDFATPGPDRLAFVRHYNSHAARRGSLGIGWTSTYDRLFDGDDLFHENQTGLNFGSTGKPSVKLGIYWYSLKDSDLRRTVLANGDVLLTGNRGVYETYDGTTGRLKTLTAPGGYEQTLAYLQVFLQRSTAMANQQLLLVNGKTITINSPARLAAFLERHLEELN